MHTTAGTDGVPAGAPGRGPVRRGRAVAGPDRLTVGLLSLAAFLLVLALLATQVRVTAKALPVRHVLVTRRVYETKVVETVAAPRGSGSASGSSVTQSVSSSGSSSPAYASGSAPATRSS